MTTLGATSPFTVASAKVGLNNQVGYHRLGRCSKSPFPRLLNTASVVCPSISRRSAPVGLHARSGRNRLGLAEEAAVGGAPRAGRQPFMGERHGDVTLTGTHGRLDQCPVDDVALRVAAADLP